MEERRKWRRVGITGLVQDRGNFTLLHGAGLGILSSGGSLGGGEVGRGEGFLRGAEGSG